MFHPLVDAWFKGRFGAPTPAQTLAWPAIARGEDCLVTAPTGSGKTLAAFLYCLDRMVRATEPLLGTRVLYVSPLKALSNDVQKNLSAPIAEIRALALAQGLPEPVLRASVRTGDTTQAERQKEAKTPPQILVTTPESLYILLTSASGRKNLETVDTIVLDEIHAIAGDKRGAHLALSVERLEDLVLRAGGKRPQRIGLSATVRPIEVAARLLVGTNAPMPTIVDVPLRRDLDLAIEVPRDELGAVCTNEQWEELYDRFAVLAKEHKSTLIFVNTRRLVERVAHHLGKRLGEEAVAAHHGSLSRARRLSAEQRLKAGDLRVVVATASLELGIDVGAVELTAIVGSPRAIGTALQRIGRSGHFVGGTPKGRFFPLTRDQLLECAAIVRGARKGILDAISLRDAPRDVLSQQLVAICSAEDRNEDELFDLVRKAAPYAKLERSDYDAIVTMMSEGIATRRARAGALLHRDAVNRVLKGRRGARLAAMTSGGAIPDNANYEVLMLPDAVKVGTIEEDYAIESSAGDIFLLGNNSWRIQRVEMGKVWVEDAHGAPPNIPFWLGEAPARTPELSRELADLRYAIADGLGAERDVVAELIESSALDAAGATLARDYVAAAIASLGAVPSETTIVIERFFDDAGGTQLVIHAPFGGRINRALGMALRKRFCRSFDFELQAAATDDGVLLSLGPQHSFPLESLLEMLQPEGVKYVLEQAALQAPMFGTRWRWNATRSLALLRSRNGKRVPPPLLRMRSDDLLAAVFPAQVGCQDNHGGAPVEAPDHPLVNETMRDCLTEYMDAEGLARVLRDLHDGKIQVVTRESPEPSVFSHEILNANPYAFLDDAPLEERRSRAVQVRRGLPAEIVERVGTLDEDAMQAVVVEARPTPRDADELHDLLLDCVAYPESLLSERRGWLDELALALRASRVETPKGIFWVAAERRSFAHALWPTARFLTDIKAPEGTPGSLAIDRDDALLALVRAHLGYLGPVTSIELAGKFGVEIDQVDFALGRVELEGGVVRGRFRAGSGATGLIDWCDRRLLARIHRRTVDGLRKAIEPVTPADLVRFLGLWQGLGKLDAKGPRALLKTIEQLQGFEIAAAAWERDIFPARVADYDPGMLDALCLSGEVVWGRLAPREEASVPTRAAPITFALRRDLPWLAAAFAEPKALMETDADGSPEATVLAFLKERGASFFDEIISETALPRPALVSALWELAARGRVTADGFENLRALFATRADDRPRIGRFRAAAPRVVAGRWALLRPPSPPSRDREALVELLARQYLRRYGVLVRELLTREPAAPPWRELVRALRRLEMRGEIRGGRLVSSLLGEQFALPEALDALRAARRKNDETATPIRLSGCDPLNLVGILAPGARVPANLGQEVVLRGGLFEPPDPPGAPMFQRPAVGLS